VARASKPPVIPGYTVVELIGQGGFSDVFLYQQARPARPVAIKILLEEQVDGPGVAQFEAEANVMAQLSSHPAIVSIYQADVTADGRPYLVMEYCPKPNLAVRCRTSPLPVPEALDLAIRISGAVETAHRAGVLHRDIKPHNILVDAYDQPKLTDFGIASATESASEQSGMSVPWSPPEMFGDAPPRDPRSDVWSLGATAYHLLAGRSPFEMPHDNNDNHTLMTRIERLPLPPLNRPDVDDRLAEVLARALSKPIANRYPTAIAFARALQDVQIGLLITPTRIDVLDSAPAPAARELDDARTSIKPILVIPQSPSVGAPSAGLVTRAPVSSPVSDTGYVVRRPQVEEHTEIKAPTAPAVDPLGAGTRGPRVDVPEPSDPVVVGATPAGEPAGRGQRRLVLTLAAAGLLVAALAVAFLATRPADEPDPESLGDQQPANANAGAPAAPTELSGRVVDGTATFTWTTANPQPGDTYRWVETTDGQTGTPHDSPEPRAALPVGASGSACIEVFVLRGGQSSQGANGCAQ